MAKKPMQYSIEVDGMKIAFDVDWNRLYSLLHRRLAKSKTGRTIALGGILRGKRISPK